MNIGFNIPYGIIIIEDGNDCTDEYIDRYTSIESAIKFATTYDIVALTMDFCAFYLYCIEFNENGRNSENIDVILKSIPKKLLEVDFCGTFTKILNNMILMILAEGTRTTDDFTTGYNRDIPELKDILDRPEGLYELFSVPFIIKDLDYVDYSLKTNGVTMRYGDSTIYKLSRDLNGYHEEIEIVLTSVMIEITSYKIEPILKG